MTYQALNFMAAEKLREAEVADPENDARQLVLFAGDMTFDEYTRKMNTEAPPEEEEKLRKATEKRAGHYPLQYITGRADFMGHVFFVDSHVLIPRFDTETLVVEAEGHMQGNEKVLDIGTGSGCVLCSILLDFPDADGTGVDVSEEALSIAESNAGQLGIRNVHFAESDLFTNIRDTYDIIVSNPPYIEKDVIETLDPEVKDYEPLTALDGGQDGLYFYRRISSEARKHLKEGGILLFEIGASQGASVKKIMEADGFRDIGIIRDLSGNERVVSGGI